jgi:hypothetical protein
MSALEKKVDALLQFCTAETEEDRGKYHLRLRKLMNAPDAVAVIVGLQERIDKILADLGIPDHLYGYKYLQTAIELSLEDPQIIYNMTCGLYPKVALRYNTRPQLVERGIRHAILCGWTRCDLEMQEKYFGGKVNPDRCKPTNTEFIARITNLLRRQGIIN